MFYNLFICTICHKNLHELFNLLNSKIKIQHKMISSNLINLLLIFWNMIVLSRNFQFFNITLFNILYPTSIRSHLEFAASVWNSFSNENIKKGGYLKKGNKNGINILIIKSFLKIFLFSDQKNCFISIFTTI